MNKQAKMVGTLLWCHGHDHDDGRHHAHDDGHHGGMEDMVDTNSPRDLEPVRQHSRKGSREDRLMGYPHDNDGEEETYSESF